MPSHPAAELLTVTTTTADRDLADQLATALVEGRLAACVHVSGPIDSTYRWQGRIERSPEWVLTAKTSAARLPQIEQLLAARHAYETPELIATPIVGGSAGYLGWLRGQVLAASEERD